MNIPVFEPEVGDEEIEAVVAALRRGEISGTFGESIPTFEQEFAEQCGTRYGVAVNSGSSALVLGTGHAVQNSRGLSRWSVIADKCSRVARSVKNG